MRNSRSILSAIGVSSPKSTQTFEANLLFGRPLVSGIRSRCCIFGVGLTVLSWATLKPTVAEAQSVWAGAGATTFFTGYNLGTNWSTNPAAPVAGGQSAEFAGFGSTSVVVTAPVAPDSWAFDANAQSYTVTGAAVNFGTATGLVNNSVGPISIANSLGGANAQLQQLGAGTLTLSGINNYTGTTTIAAGTLALTGTGSIAASNQVNLTNAGATFDISGTTAGASITSLVGVSGSNVNLGAQTLTITAGNSGYSGIIGGSGGLTATSGAIVQLFGANTYTGVTTINSGALVGIGNAPSLVNSSKVIDNGALDFSITTADSSIKSLAGTNTNAKVFLSSHFLTLTAANDTFAGVISGNGGLTLAAGDEKLTGTSTYAGATTINGGALAVNGSIATSSLTTVNAGAALTGTGTVGNTTINTGGEFAPGLVTPGSFMTVGTLTLQPGALYEIGLNPTTSSFASVIGPATLGGATVQAIYGFGSYVAKQYTILTAGSIIGTFGSLVNTNLPANFKSTLAYDPTHAYLNLALNFTPPTSPSTPSSPSTPASGAPNSSGLNGNQQNVANALTNFFNTTGGIPLAFGALTPAGLTQVSGESATGSQQTTFDAMGQFMGMMTDPFMNRTGGSGAPSTSSGYADDANAYAATKKTDAFAMFTKAPPQTFDPRWSVWSAGYGGSQSTSGNALVGSNNTTSSIAGTAVGADYLFSPNTLAGFALAGGGTSFSVANGGTGRSDLFQFGANVRHNEGPAYVSAALAYGWQDITTNRTVTAAGFDQLRAEFNANAWSGRLEGGYRLVPPATFGIGITPYAAAQFVTFELPAYAEQAIAGANTFALNYGAKDVTDPRSELGFRTDQSFTMPDGILTLRGRFAWAHDYDANRSIAATFQTLPGAGFVVNGAAQAAESALTTASVEMKWRNGWSAAATFDGEFSNVTNSYAGKGVLRYAW
jgi:autotransporter-associated beta strand protein